MEAIVALVTALAWPVAAVVIAVLFRKPLGDALATVRSLKVGDVVEATFGADVEHLKQAAGDLPTVHTDAAAIAAVSPRAAILEAWIDLEQAARAALKRRHAGLDAAALRQPIALASALAEHGVLKPRRLAVFDELRNLRNAAAHAERFRLEPSAAVGYVGLAKGLASELDKG
jgi:hypothetical protein